MTKNKLERLRGKIEWSEGRVGPPLLLWVLGVPGSICLILWFFFFRG